MKIYYTYLKDNDIEEFQASHLAVNTKKGTEGAIRSWRGWGGGGRGSELAKF